MELFITIGDSQVWSNFLVFITHPIGSLLGTESIKQDVLEMLSNESELITRSSRFVAVISSRLNTVNNTVITEDLDSTQVKSRNCDVKVVNTYGMN